MTNADTESAASETTSEATVVSFRSPGSVTTYSSSRAPGSQSWPDSARYASTVAATVARSVTG